MIKLMIKTFKVPPHFLHFLNEILSKHPRGEKALQLTAPSGVEA